MKTKPKNNAVKESPMDALLKGVVSLARFARKSKDELAKLAVPSIGLWEKMKEGQSEDAIAKMAATIITAVENAYGINTEEDKEELKKKRNDVSDALRAIGIQRRAAHEKSPLPNLDKVLAALHETLDKMVKAPASTKSRYGRRFYDSLLKVAKEG
jgi:hypothetical protein